MVTSSCPTTTRTTEGLHSGIPQRALGVPRERRTPGVQAGLVRGARRGGGARHRAGRHAAPVRKIRRPAGGRAAAALSSHRAERRARLVPAPEGAFPVDHAPLLAFRGRGRRRSRSAGTLEAADGSNRQASPAEELEQAQVLEIIEQELARLPGRQREAFIMRYWEELDVAETAKAMGCSEGSVKTHCSRAAHALAAALKARGITL